MKKVQITNHVLLERSKLFAKYGENMPRKTDKLELQLDFPNCGLIKMHFKVNEEEKVLIAASDVYEPFEDIKEWLEQIVKHLFDFTTSVVKINDEFDDYFLYYEPFYFHSDELLTKHPPKLDGLFYVYDTSERKIVSDAVVETKMFVKAIYESILNYAKESSKNQEFVDAWTYDAYNYEIEEDCEEDPMLKELFIKKVTSPIVEKFLGDNNSDVRFVAIK